VADKHAFLSDDWFAEVERLVNENSTDAAPAHANVLVNLTITDTPFGEERQLHMGAKEGQGAFAKGHADGADVTLTTDYSTAKDVFVSGNPQAGMQAFMAGKVKVQGDMTKLMAAQAGGGGGGNDALQQAIQEMTE
jgi:putative sterol carrier protein